MLQYSTKRYYAKSWLNWLIKIIRLIWFLTFLQVSVLLPDAFPMPLDGITLKYKQHVDLKPIALTMVSVTCWLSDISVWSVYHVDCQISLCWSIYRVDCQIFLCWSLNSTRYQCLYWGTKYYFLILFILFWGYLSRFIKIHQDSRDLFGTWMQISPNIIFAVHKHWFLSCWICCIKLLALCDRMVWKLVTQHWTRVRKFG